MLVLTRRIDESLFMGKKGEELDIVVRVLGINGNQVRIGISAPDNIHIIREELMDKLLEQRARDKRSKAA